MSQPTFYQPYISTAVTVDSRLNTLQGIKKNDFSGITNSYLATGTTGDAIAPPGYGALYIGAIDGATSSTGSGSGTWYNFSVPSTWNPRETSAYGPDILTRGNGPSGIGDVALAGTWINSTGTLLGWYYKGSLSALNGDTAGSVSTGFQSFQATTENHSLARYTYLHSVDGAFVVGNYSTRGGLVGLLFNVGQGSGSYIYNPLTQAQVNIKYPDSAKYHSTFGIWANDDNTYTISGGASYNQRSSRNSRMESSIATVAKAMPDAALGRGMFADVDPITGIASNLHYYNYNNASSRYTNVLTHFQGIYYMGSDVYQAPFVAIDASGSTYAGNAYVHRLSNGQFSENAIWQTFEANSSGEKAIFSTSVAGNADTGVFSDFSPFASYGDNQSYFLAAQNLK